jgi:hypothetical protein
VEFLVKLIQEIIMNAITEKMINSSHAILKGLFSLSVFIFSVYAYGCSNHKVIGDPPPGFIGGYITDSITAQPIYQAWISHDSVFDTTDVFAFADSAGYYVLYAGFPSIHRWTYCGKNGYVTQSREYSVSSLDTTKLDFELVRGVLVGQKR